MIHGFEIGGFEVVRSREFKSDLEEFEHAAQDVSCELSFGANRLFPDRAERRIHVRRFPGSNAV